MDVYGEWVAWEIDDCGVWRVSEVDVLIFSYGLSLSGRVLSLWHGLRSGVSINMAVLLSYVFVVSFTSVLGGGGGGEEEMSNSSSSLTINCSSRLNSGSCFAPNFRASNKVVWAEVRLELESATDCMVGGSIGSTMGWKWDTVGWKV